MPRLKLQQQVLEALEAKEFLPFTTSQIKTTSAFKSGQNHWLQYEDTSKARVAVVSSTLHMLKSSYEDVARTLILVESKEVADEYFEMFEALGKHTDLRVWTAYKGPNILNQKEKIYFGSDVVIATPQRLNELLNIEGFNSAGLLTLVLDNADKLLKVGVNSFTQRISDSVPNRQRISLSAVNGKGVQTYMDRFAYPFTAGVLS